MKIPMNKMKPGQFGQRGNDGGYVLCVEDMTMLPAVDGTRPLKLVMIYRDTLLARIFDYDRTELVKILNG